jgi:hypothetical protein
MPRSSVMRSMVVGLLAVVLAGTGLLAAGPAGAVAVPYAPAFHPGIDAYSSYETENTCSPAPKPGVVAWRDLLLRTYGSRWNNISRACSASISGHEEGRSLDYGNLATNATQKAQADALFGWLFATDKNGNKHAMARRLGIQYIQYNNRMWRAYNATAGWQPQMLGGKACSTLGSTYKTSCHRDHIHFSFSWNGAWKKTSFFTGNVACPTPVDQPAFTAAMPVNLTAVPVAPARIFSTLTGAGACRLQPKGRLDVKVTGVGGVPSTGVGAVALNVTGVRPSGTSATYLSVYPAGTPYAGNSTVNVAVGGTSAALVIVPVGSSGRVSIRSSYAPIDVNVDVAGYFTTATTGSTYTALAEQTLVNTQQTTIMAAKERRKLQVTGQFGIPAGATGVLVNVTTSGSSTSGNVGVSPSFEAGVGTSNVYFPNGDSVSNRAVVKLAADGSIEAYASSITHVRIDVVGWFGTGGQGLHYNPVIPGRILDTRSGVGGVPPLTGGVPADVTVALQRGIPADAHSVVGTLTVIRPTAAANATMWTAGDSKPLTSNFGVPLGAVRDGLVSPELSTGGKAALAVSAGSSDATLDVLGYFR